MSTVKRWKIKEHYVAGEFAGYVVVTDDKYEDVVCHGIGVDYRPTAVLIASAPEQEAECDRLRKTIYRIERKINSAKTACPPFVQREFEEAQKWAHEALEGGK